MIKLESLWHFCSCCLNYSEAPIDKVGDSASPNLAEMLPLSPSTALEDALKAKAMIAGNPSSEGKDLTNPSSSSNSDSFVEELDDLPTQEEAVEEDGMLLKESDDFMLVDFDPKKEK